MQVLYKIALGIELAALAAVVIGGLLALNYELVREGMEEDDHGKA